MVTTTTLAAETANMAADIFVKASDAEKIPVGFAERLVKCESCNRKFENLERHLPFCLDASKKKRAKFLSEKQRAIRMGDILVCPGTRGHAKKQEDPAVAKAVLEAKKQKAKAVHEEFLRTMQGARRAKAAMLRGAALPPPLPSTYNPDYIKCQYCERSFNKGAAERHVPYCKQKMLNQPMKPAPKKVSSSGTVGQAAPVFPQKPSSTIAVSGTSDDRQKPCGVKHGSSAVALSKKGTSESSVTMSESCGIKPSQFLLEKNRSSPLHVGTKTKGSAQNSGPPSNQLMEKVSLSKSFGDPSGSAYHGEKFCSECGEVFRMSTAKFCGECGKKRM